MQQLTFFDVIGEVEEEDLTRDSFSHDNICSENARIALEES
jgi:hypothetical protein